VPIAATRQSCRLVEAERYARGQVRGLRASLEFRHSLGERVNRRIELWFDQTYERHLEDDNLLWRTLHLSHGPPKGLEYPDGSRKSQPRAPLNQPFTIRVHRVSHVGGNLEKKYLAHFAREALGQLLGVPATLAKQCERLEGLHGVLVDQRVKKPVELWLGLDGRTSRHELVERTQGVTGRTPGESNGNLDRGVIGRPCPRLLERREATRSRCPRR